MKGDYILDGILVHEWNQSFILAHGMKLEILEEIHKEMERTCKSLDRQ